MISKNQFPVRNNDEISESIRDDSVSLLGRVLVTHGSNGRRMPGAVHQLHCGCARGGRQRQACVSQIMRKQTIPTHTPSSPLPRGLQYVGRLAVTSRPLGGLGDSRPPAAGEGIPEEANPWGNL